MVQLRMCFRTEKEVERYLTIENREIQTFDGKRTVSLCNLAWDELDFLVSCDGRSEPELAEAANIAVESSGDRLAFDDALHNVIALLGNRYI